MSVKTRREDMSVFAAACDGTDLHFLYKTQKTDTQVKAGIAYQCENAPAPVFPKENCLSAPVTDIRSLTRTFIGLLLCSYIATMQ